MGRDLEQVPYAEKRILGYGDFVILKYSNNTADYRSTEEPSWYITQETTTSGRMINMENKALMGGDSREDESEGPGIIVGATVRFSGLERRVNICRQYEYFQELT